MGAAGVVGRGVAGARGGDGGGGAGDADGGHGAGGVQFHAFGAKGEEAGPCARDGRGLSLSEASGLLWVLLVGTGHAGGVGERRVLGRVCRGAVEIFQEEDPE